MEQDQITAHAQRTASAVATQVRRSFPTVDLEDLRSEALLGALESGALTRWQNADSDHQDAAEAACRRAMRRQAERYARGERAAQTGYRPEDEAFYALGHLRILLESYYADGLTEQPPTGRADSVTRSSSDPASRGDWLAGVSDVSRGLERIPARYAERLYLRYHVVAHLSDQQVADLVLSHSRFPIDSVRVARALGDTPDQIHTRTRTALRALQQALGGPSPWTLRKGER